MKSIQILIIALSGAILSLATTSCSTEDLSSPDRIDLSVISYTFAPEGETFHLEVSAVSTSEENWHFQGGDEWISAERTENGLALTAASNEGGEMRETTISFICGKAKATLYLTQLPGKFSGGFVNMTASEYGYQSRFSNNSNFCAAYALETPEGSAQIFIPILINTRTGEETRYEGSADYSAIRAVSDDGRMISLTVGSVGCALLVDGQTMDIPCPSGYKTPVVSGFSTDGNVMVGYVQETDGYAYYPVKWTNMIPEVLDIPETDVQGEDLFSGAMARGCSADGSVVYGSEWDTQAFVYWDAEGMHFAGKETSVNRTVDYMGMTLEIPAYFKKTAENYSISQNGRYIAGIFNDYTDNGDGTYSPYSVSYPAIYDTQTDELTVYEDYSGYSAMFADNEGRLFGGVAGMGYVFDESGAVPIEEWMASQYGIVMDGSRYILNISEDGKNVSGWRTEMNASSQTLLIGWYYVQQ